MAFDPADPPKFTEEQISHIVVRVWDVAGNVSEEKARDIVLDKTPPTASHTLTPGKDGKRNYSEFLGFKIKVHNLRVNTKPLLELMRQPLYNGSAEYADNRLSLFSAQWGRCAVTGAEFTATSDIHCHHKKLKSNGGSDKYENLVLVLEPT